MAIPLLTILALVPIVGAVLLFFIKGPAARLIGYGFALTTAILGVLAFVFHTQGTALAENLEWIPAVGAHYALDLDGMGAILVLMTVIVVPVVLLAEWNVGEDERALGEQRLLRARAAAAGLRAVRLHGL